MARGLHRLMILVLLAALSGCTDAEQGSPGSAAIHPAGSGMPTVDPSAGSGAIEGRVTDDEGRPLEGVSLGIPSLGLTTASGRDGAVRIDDVPVGSWPVVATSTRHLARLMNVTVNRGETTRLDVMMAPRPSEAPYYDTVTLVGHYTCAHEMPLWTGDCMLVYESQTGQNDTLTDETFAYRIIVGEGWESVVLELVWTYAANNQFDGMRLYLENGNGTESGHSFKVGRTDGLANPLRLQVNRGEPHPRADYYVGTNVQAFIPDAGEEVQIRVFPRGKLYEQTSLVCTNPFQNQGCLLGVGLGLDIQFTVYASVFYRARALDTFTAVA